MGPRFVGVGPSVGVPARSGNARIIEMVQSLVMSQFVAGYIRSVIVSVVGPAGSDIVVVEFYG